MSISPRLLPGFSQKSPRSIAAQQHQTSGAIRNTIQYNQLRDEDVLNSLYLKWLIEEVEQESELSRRKEKHQSLPKRQKRLKKLLSNLHVSKHITISYYVVLLYCCTVILLYCCTVVLLYYRYEYHTQRFSLNPVNK